MSILRNNPIYLTLLDGVEASLRKAELFGKAGELYGFISVPPDESLGHLSIPVFKLTKENKMKPPELAKLILENFPDNISWVEKIELKGPYINFYFNHAKLAQTFMSDILQGNIFTTTLSENTPKTMVEYSQPNTHKEIHVGHMRNLCLGDALVNILKYCDYSVIKSTFPGDVGTHVAKCLWYLKYHYSEKWPEADQGSWLGRIYSMAHLKLEDERGSEKEEQNRTQLTQILKELESQNGEYYELWKKTRAWSIELMERIYRWAKIDFDVWYWESQVDSDSVKLAKEYYQKGLFTKSEGAIGMDLSEDKLGFCLLIKSDGNGLYATKDIELARRKFLDHNIEQSLYVVDKRQEYHFKQVFKVLEKMGFKNAKNCHHIQYDFVELPDGAMSSRKGNIIPLTDLVDNMVATIKERYLNRYQDEWEACEIDTTAHIIARGAIKFGMTRIDTSKKIVFDMDEWLKLDGESGPYIQYVCARINSMLKKIGDINESLVNYELLTNPREHELLRHLMSFNSQVQQACEQFRPSVLSAYLYDLAKLYNSFYADCPVQSAASGLKEARYQLSKATTIILKKGLELLGIEVPQRM